MDDNLQHAIEAVGTAKDEETLLAACEYLVAHRDQLVQRVFINLPGGLGGNNDARWRNVKANSKERCNCGNERVILPANQRTKYEASSAAASVVTKEQPAYVKPIGGDKASTFVQLRVVDSEKGPAFTFLSDPFAPLVFSMDLFSSQGYLLSLLAESLKRQPGKPAVLCMADKTPILGITAVDADAGTVTFSCDKDAEAYVDPDSLPDVHSCK